MTSAFRKYVHKANNRWVVQKTINGKLKAFKAFKKLNEAIDYRDKLIKNNWQEPKPTNQEIQQQETKKYYRNIYLNTKKRRYKINNKKSQYLGTVNTIEEALYYRDLYSNCPTGNIPRPEKVDLVTDNPYIIDGLRYPLPERLVKQENYTDYGKGSIVKKSKSSYAIKLNSTHFCTCRTYEQAYYVRRELQKCDWDKNQVPRILADYPKWYTWLMQFYRYIIRNPQTKDSFILNFPKKYCKEARFERITYHKLEDALFERDFLVKHDWDYEALVYSIDDTNNPYYDMELPPYPQRKMRNVSERNTYVDELNSIRDCLLGGMENQEGIAETIGTSTVNIRNWLGKYNTTWKDFKNLVLSGEDIWTVLEMEERYYTPDLSPSMPSNFNNYVHRNHSKRSPYCVSRKGEYYGSYKDKKTARKVVSELKKVDWDKSHLKRIQEEVGFEKFINTKRWVYEANNGRSWCIRKKDKTRKMINYGCYKDKAVAECVRDLLLENDWDKDRLSEFRRIAEEEVNKE